MSRSRSEAITAARYIVKVDFDAARRWLAGRKAFTVTEIRALNGAMEAAHRKYGSPRHFFDWWFGGRH